jgi:mannan endo-1,4-beta-mannosidase
VTSIVKPSFLTAIALLLAATPAAAQTYRFEAESGALSGVTTANSGGTTYVTGFDNDSDKVTINAGSVPNGLYELWVRYQSPYGWKGYTVQVDGERGDGGFDSSGSQFKLDRAGVFDLNAGAANSIQLQKNWGYYNVDYFELRPATVPQVLPVAPTLSDPLATNRTKYLMNYLTSLYGSKTLAAQEGNVGSNVPFPSSTYLTASGGVVPAVRGSDFMDHSPSRIAHGTNPNGETERIINWAKQTGGIPNMMWHWNAPTDLIDGPNGSGQEWWRGFYTSATTFDVKAALDGGPGSPKYDLLLRDIDAIGNELRKFQDAGIPVIWRPLHEAQGSGGNTWFWWSKDGAQPFVELWRLMYDRLENVDGIHNLIWVYTSTPANEDFKAWYPGDDVVDIVGTDIYTDKTSSMSGQWLDLLDQYNGKKMISLAETGTLPDPNLFDQRGIHWSWFMPWQVDGSPYGVTTNYTPTQIKNVLNHDDVVTLNELPVTPWSNAAVPNGDLNGDGHVDGADFLAWQQQQGRLGDNAADINGDGQVNALDLAILRQLLAQGAAANPVPEPTACGLALLAIALALPCGRFVVCRPRA